MTLGVMLGCFMEAFSYALDGRVFPGSIVMNYIANTYLFTANLLLPFCVLMYVDFSFGGNMQRIRSKYKVHIIIGLIMLATNIVNFFTPIIYWISEQNVYERRPFGYMFYAVILFYCISALVQTHRYEKQLGTKSFISIPVFLIPIIIGAALQFMFYGLSLAWLSSACGLMGLHMMQQNETAFIDPLVGIYNRSYLNRVLESWIGRGFCFSGAMIDVDFFKSINDSFGHSEGDHALQIVTDFLTCSRTENEWIFRFAGDEFIVLKLASTKSALANANAGLSSFMDRVSHELAVFNEADHPYQLSLSYGISDFDGGDIDSFMKDMDHEMYQMKALHHSTRPLQR